MAVTTLCGQIILNLLELGQGEDSEVTAVFTDQDGAHCQGDGSGPDSGLVASPSSLDASKKGVSPALSQ